MYIVWNDCECDGCFSRERLDEREDIDLRSSFSFSLNPPPCLLDLLLLLLLFGNARAERAGELRGPGNAHRVAPGPVLARPHVALGRPRDERQELRSPPARRAAAVTAVTVTSERTDERERNRTAHENSILRGEAA